MLIMLIKITLGLKFFQYNFPSARGEPGYPVPAGRVQNRRGQIDISDPDRQLRQRQPEQGGAYAFPVSRPRQRGQATLLNNTKF